FQIALLDNAFSKMGGLLKTPPEFTARANPVPGRPKSCSVSHPTKLPLPLLAAPPRPTPKLLGPVHPRQLNTSKPPPNWPEKNLAALGCISPPCQTGKVKIPWSNPGTVNEPLPEA